MTSIILTAAACQYNKGILGQMIYKSIFNEIKNDFPVLKRRINVRPEKYLKCLKPERKPAFQTNE